jgi:hypothetical protein
MYRGRNRSHRFTILGDTAFEYDCILNREPESNVITLLMEGAEKFDFFRQPDFVQDPFLKGSYAVYKKETLVGEGTGKLCHIHRPEIIDGRGRRCWGDLSIVGNRLCITIPETWLSEAKYPVTVDPTIGTATVGSQTPKNKGAGAKDPWLIYEFGVNRFLLTEKCQGVCTAHVYCYDQVTSIGDVTPLIFGDENGKPHYRRTQNEATISTRLVNLNNINIVYEPQWKTGSFETIGGIQEGEYIWFGCYGAAFWTKFDYGGTLYKNYPEVFVEQEEEEYYNEETGEWEWTEGIYYDLPDFPLDGNEKSIDCIFSWYFDFESLSKNYIRTLTQGVTLTDSRKQVADYKRAAAVNANNTTLLGHSSNYYREHINLLTVSDTASRFRGFFRSLAEQLHTGDFISCCRDFLRTIAVTLRPETHGEKNLSARRDVADQAGTGDSTTRERGFIRTLVAAVSAGDYAGKVQAWFRAIQEQAAAFGKAGHLGDYIRELYTEAGNMAETWHEGEYYRKQQDTAYSEAVPLRHLFIFLRLATLSLVRDYLIPRFLRSREELVIKSPIMRELTLESRVQEWGKFLRGNRRYA